jgi:hypothetical protein
MGGSKPPFLVMTLRNANSATKDTRILALRLLGT